MGMRKYLAVVLICFLLTTTVSSLYLWVLSAPMDSLNFGLKKNFFNAKLEFVSCQQLFI